MALSTKQRHNSKYFTSLDEKALTRRAYGFLE